MCSMCYLENLGILEKNTQNKRSIDIGLTQNTMYIYSS